MSPNGWRNFSFYQVEAEKLFAPLVSSPLLGLTKGDTGKTALGLNTVCAPSGARRRCTSARRSLPVPPGKGAILIKWTVLAQPKGVSSVVVLTPIGTLWPWHACRGLRAFVWYTWLVVGCGKIKKKQRKRCCLDGMVLEKKRPMAGEERWWCLRITEF